MGSPPQSQAIESAPVPTPAAPVTATNSEVIQAQQDYAQQNLLKKSINKTILAGDTGGFQPGQMGAPGVGGAPVSFKGK